MRSDQTISRKPQYIRWWLLASALIAIGLILIYYISPSIRNERKAAQKRFNEIQHELASVTGDQLVFESNPTGNVIDGDGEKIHKDCFTGEAEQIFQAERVFDDIIEGYSAKLDELGFEALVPNTIFKGTPDEQTTYAFRGKDTFVVFYPLIPHLDDMSQWGISSSQKEVYYYRVGFLFEYPSSTRCKLMGY